MDFKKIFKNEQVVMFGFILLITFIFGFLAHSYAFYNPALANDGLQIDLLVDQNWQISIGRFFQPVIRYFTFVSYTPFLSGVFWILFYSIALFFLARTLNIQNKLLIAIISALIITSGSHIEAFSACENWNVIFAFNFMLAIISVYVFNRYKFGFIFSGVIIILVFAIYQSFACVAVTLFVICTIKKLLKENFKISAIYLLKCALTVLVATILYFILLKVVLKVTGVEIEQDMYNSPNQVKFLGIKPTIVLTIKSYIVFVRTLTLFSSNKIALNHGGELVLIALYMVVFIATIVLFVKLIKVKKLNWLNVIGVLFLVAVLPICACLFYIVTGGMSGHRLLSASYLIFTLPVILYEEFKSINGEQESGLFSINKISIGVLVGVIVVGQLACYVVIKKFFYGRIFMKFFYQTFLLYLIPLYMFILLKKQKINGFIKIFTKSLLTILICLTLLNNISFANEIHFNNHLKYQATYNEMSNLMEIMEDSLDFKEENDIFVVGELSAAYTDNYELGVTYDGTITYFFNYIFNRDYRYPIQIEELKSRLTDLEIEQINNMPCYPSEDCVATIGGVTVVKLSNATI